MKDEHLLVEVVGVSSDGLEDYVQGVPVEKSKPTIRINGNCYFGVVTDSLVTDDERVGIRLRVKVIGSSALRDDLRLTSSFDLLAGTRRFATCRLEAYRFLDLVG